MAITTNAQETGLPYIENIPFSKIGYCGKLGAIMQDANNVLYIENENGVLVFNGTSWQLLSVQGKPTLHKDNSGSIYVTTNQSIAKIEYDEYQQIKIHSLIADTVHINGNISDFASLHNHSYFVANNVLYELQNGVPQKIEQYSQVTHLFLDRERLLVATKSNIYEYGDIVKPLCSTPLVVSNILRVTNGLLLVTKENIVRLTNSKTIVPFTTEIDSILKAGNFISLEKTFGDAICIGTKNSGIYCINTQGVLQYKINESNGLLNNKICGLLIDKNNNVWVTTHKGIARIELFSAIAYYNDYNGLYGNISALIRDGNNNIIVGTDCGIYKIDNKGCKKICTIECNSLTKTTRGDIIAATNEGLQLIQSSQNVNEQTIATGNFKNIYSLDNQIISVSEDYLTLLDEKYAPIAKFTLPNIEITSIAKGTHDCVAFCGTKQNGVWMLTWKYNADSIKHLDFIPCNWQGLPKNTQTIYVYGTSSGTIFSTYEGLFRCDIDNQFFYHDGKIMTSETVGKCLIYPIIEDEDNNLWMAFHKVGVHETQIAVAWNTNNGERFTLITAPFTKIQDFHTDCIYPSKNSIVWLGGVDGLIRLDFNKMSIRKTLGAVQISKIQVNDKQLYSPTIQNTIFPYNTKSIVFDFASIEYENRDDIYYSYFLEGQDENWSSPTKFHEKEYTNLPAGKYVFHVIAKCSNGAMSKETTFAFEVKRHPLLSIWAFAFYCVLLLALVLCLMKTHRKKLSQEKRLITQLAENKRKETQESKETHENLTANNLLDETTHEIKETGKVRSMNFEMVTILFSDFKGFTKIANHISADALIQELDTYFSEFDKIVERYNVEKIKTIGDTYMCAGGIPKKNTTNPIEVVAVALEIQYRLAEMQKELPNKSELWGVRIGIHTGPVIAGVVGSDKYSYDIWGDSVNIANHMEASGEVGRVNISESTYTLVRDIFDCEYRGKIPVKGRDEKMDMYFVNGFKTNFAENQLKSLPNKEFTYKLALFRFEGLQEQIYTMLEQNLPKNYFYHNLKHTIDVVTQVEVIGQAEGISDEDMYILKTAALFHDAGFIHTYKNHERESIEIAKQILPNEGYSSEQISRICRLIEVTIITEKPKNLLEEIIRDADLDYLGRNDYVCVSRELYKEFLEMKFVKKNEYDWIVGQIKFLQEHTYYTNYSRSQRNPIKVKHIQSLQEEISKFNNIS